MARHRRELWRAPAGCARRLYGIVSRHVMDAVVRTAWGRVRGQVGDGIVSFKGIPFAAPPEGSLRFRPPAAPAGWDGVRDAVAFGPAPPQLSPAP